MADSVRFLLGSIWVHAYLLEGEVGAAQYRLRLLQRLRLVRAGLGRTALLRGAAEVTGDRGVAALRFARMDLPLSSARPTPTNSKGAIL